jgi:hypothetical protein
MQAGLKPRIRPKLELVLADGRARCDRELTEIIFCERRSVQRILEQMHQQKLVHIGGWAKAGDSYRWRPKYKLGAGDDVPAPAPTGRTSTQRVKEYRAKMTADDKDFADARRRQKRRVVKRDPLTAAFFGGPI